MTIEKQKNLATIRVERSFAQAPSSVWRALTRPELLARWWAAGDIAPVVGHQFTLDMGHWGHVPCRVLEVEPERRLVFTFNAWTLTWTLSEDDGGTRLILEQSGIDLDTPQGRFAFERMGGGWRDEVLPRLGELLNEIDPRETTGGADGRDVKP
ncbi:MAG TPA: SRPBCC domain-containing protein [Polyangiaceae bacterium]|nr:SRPBCC domain-containing protein [Polyangiaceae bacterium]